MATNDEPTWKRIQDGVKEVNQIAQDLFAMSSAFRTIGNNDVADKVADHAINLQYECGYIQQNMAKYVEELTERM